MAAPENIVIIGGGLAGAKAAETLRKRGYEGGVTVVGAENHVPYERPPISKEYLAGTKTLDEASVHDAGWYEERGIELLLGTTATSIDRAARTVELDGGEALPYDALLLATGSEPRRLGVPGDDAEGVHVLRTVEDADAIRTEFGGGRRLAVIGGGWIGLEVAAAAKAAGTDVIVIYPAVLPLLSVLGAEIAQVFADLHTDNGVELRGESRATEIVIEGGRAAGVRLDDGTLVEAEAVVVGVGATPRVELAEAAGLEVDNGVLVDAALRTSDPAIFAVGDIANHDHPVLGRRVRIEHWATSLNQPKAAAAAILGSDDPYTELPYFYSDQFDLGMEYVGYAPEGEYERVVVRGDLASREFVAFWLRADDTIAAAMNVNVWDVPDAVGPLIAERRVVDPDRLADPSVEIGDL